MTTISDARTPPFYKSRPQMPSTLAMLTMLRQAMSDPASVIPATIYDEWALKLPGPASPVIIAHPDDVRHVLLDKGELFGRNRQLRMMMRRAWGEGLAAAEGESWVEQHRAAAPAFRPQAVEEATATMAEVARRLSSTLPTAQPIELGTAVGRIVAEVVMTTLLTGLDDIDYDALVGDIPHFVREVTTFGLLDMAPISDGLLDRLRGIGQSPQEARLRALVARLVAARSSPPDRVQDIPALMRGVGPLADNILGFMPAGYETSALAAAWAVHLLALYPDWQDAVRAEAQTSQNGTDQRPIARQVAQEALRLYPPAPILVRAAMKPTEILGYSLKPGQVVIIPVFAIHRHRQLWDRPEAFDPARFGPAATYDRAAYLPFGAGPRMCIAASFALAEITVILSELVKAFDFAPTGPAPDVSLKTTTHSRTGLHVIARKRAA
jgi:cytochrome P450